MALEIRQHIELRGDNRLDARVSGTHYKAYLVANLALNDGPQAAAEHYCIPLASVYGELACYCDNEAAFAAGGQAGRGPQRLPQGEVGGDGAGDVRGVSGCPRCGGRCQNDDCSDVLGLRRGAQADTRLTGVQIERD